MELYKVLKHVAYSISPVDMVDVEKVAIAEIKALRWETNMCFKQAQKLSLKKGSIVSKMAKYTKLKERRKELLKLNDDFCKTDIGYEITRNLKYGEWGIFGYDKI